MKKYLLIVSFLVAVILILPNVSLAQTGGGSSVLGAPSVADLQAQIAALLAQIQALQAQMSQQQPQQWCYNFKYNLNAQSRGKEVSQLQTALEKEGFEIDAYEKANQIFDESTASAVSGFQEKYRDEILTPNKLKYATGFVGKSTRAKLNSLYGCGVIRPIPTTQPYLSISPTDITVGTSYSYQFTGIVSNATPNSDVKLYLQRPDGTMKVEDYYVGKTDSNGVLKAIHNQSTPAAYGGAYSAWVEVDGKKSNVVNINVTSATQPSITVLSPNGGEIWKVGEARQIKWNSMNAGDSIYIDIFDQPIISTILPIAPSGLAIPNTGYYNWTIPPVSQLPGGGKSANYLIRVHNGTGGLGDSSDKSFSIIMEATTTIPLPDLAIEDVKLEPATPMVNTYGGEARLTFAIANRGNAVVKDASKRINPVVYPDKSSFFYSYKNSGCSAAILEPGQACYFSYNISFIPTKIGIQNMIIEFDSSYNIQESNVNNNKYVHTFNVIFSTAPYINVSSPNGGEVLEIGKTYSIEWNGSNFSPTTTAVKIGLRDIRYEPNLGSGEQVIISAADIGLGRYNWTIPQTLGSMRLGGDNIYKIVVYAVGTAITDISDAPFSIVSGSTTNKI